jgi:sarcosine oxidase subunit alpha
MRIEDHPILHFKRDKEITFLYNKRPLKAYSGETVAAALHAAGITTLSKSLKYGRPRGFFCGIGKCSSCLMRINGIPDVRACIQLVEDGMTVESQETKELPSKTFPLCNVETKKADVLIVGAGPAGLSAGIEAGRRGAKTLLIDENPMMGGQLIKQTHKFFGSKQERAGVRGIHIAEELKEQIEHDSNGHVDVLSDTTVFGYYGKKKTHILGASNKTENTIYELLAGKVIFACGAQENILAFPGNDLPGVYGAGGVQTLMNVYGVNPGERVLMVGSGNVGLIVSYQLLQAGVNVERVIEALPRIGGYHVHAAKLRRCGIPIYTSYSLKEVYGNEEVEGAIVAQVDENWEYIEGSEEDVQCDTVCLAVGLSPSIRLLVHAGVKQIYVPQAGGYVAVHDENMQTSQKGLYVAGDASGVEEASTAMVEGHLAGAHAAESLGYRGERVEELKDILRAMRSGPFGEKARNAKEIIFKEATYERL